MDSQTTAAQPIEPLTIPAEVKNFLESLLQDSGMTTLDDEMKAEMINELYARLDNFLTSSIVNNLDPEYLDAFIRLNEEKKPKEEIEQFLKMHMPNAQDVFAKAFMEFRDLYLGNVTVARNAPVPNRQNVEPGVPVVPAAVKPAEA